MDTSPDISELLKALSKAQGEFENAKKGSTNPHFRNKYADLAEIINSTRDILAKYGLSVSQLLDSDEKDHYVVTILGHSSGQWLRSRARLILQKHDSQGIGSATTYMRRYSLAAILGISQEDDDGNAASHSRIEPKHPEPPKKQSEPKPEFIDINQINELLRYAPIDSEKYKKVIAYYQIRSLDQLPKEHFQATLEKLSKPKE